MKKSVRTAGIEPATLRRPAHQQSSERSRQRQPLSAATTDRVGGIPKRKTVKAESRLRYLKLVAVIVSVLGVNLNFRDGTAGLGNDHLAPIELLLVLG